MNKDFQKILILWIISIIISSVALYSFRDVKFKNTKKLAEQNNKQQEIVEEYQELFADPNDIFNTEDKKDLATTWDIYILLPKFLFNSWFIKISKQLEEKDIKVNFKFVDTFSTYKKQSLSWLTNSDIYLLPSNWLAWFELETINIWENPKVYFNKVFNNILSINENKFIPFSIDPALSIRKNNIKVWLNREDLFSYTAIREQNKTYAMPIIRWIWKNDIRLLERLDEPFENYFDIIYLQLNQIKKSKNISELKNMLDIEKISLDYKYNFATFKQLYETIQKRDENCKLFPAICLMSYNFWDIKFWFLSDFDILDTYFSKNKNSFKMQSFTNSTTSYPVKWRIFVVPKWNEKINLANEFFKEYIKEGIANNTGLRNNTLSAINSVYNVQKQQEIYWKIMQNENNFELIYESINLQENFIKDSKNLDLLKWNYSPELYLRN